MEDDNTKYSTKKKHWLINMSVVGVFLYVLPPMLESEWIFSYAAQRVFSLSDFLCILNGFNQFNEKLSLYFQMLRM